MNNIRIKLAEFLNAEPLDFEKYRYLPQYTFKAIYLYEGYFYSYGLEPKYSRDIRMGHGWYEVADNIWRCTPKEHMLEGIPHYNYNFISTADLFITLNIIGGESYQDQARLTKNAQQTVAKQFHKVVSQINPADYRKWQAENAVASIWLVRWVRRNKNRYIPFIKELLHDRINRIK